MQELTGLRAGALSSQEVEVGAAASRADGRQGTCTERDSTKAARLHTSTQTCSCLLRKLEQLPDTSPVCGPKFALSSAALLVNKVHTQ